MNNTALDGILVIDFSHFIAGPLSTMILADLGAKVVKIENPSGDGMRSFRPHIAGESAAFLAMNRNKRGITLDLNCAEGRDTARALIEHADVVVENFSTGVMERFGLDYPTVSRNNPRLVYCSVSAYGRTGHLAERTGFDPVVQAESGFMSMNGDPDGPGFRAGPSIMDVSAGMMGANAIMGALLARDRIGRGQKVDVALFDTAITMLGFHGMNFLVSGVNPTRFGNMSVDSAPTGVFAAADGDFYLACASDKSFQQLAIDVLDRSDLAMNALYARSADRVKHRFELAALLNQLFAGDSRGAWLAKMRKAGVPAGSINTIEEALTGPEVRERGLLSSIPHPTAGQVPNIGPSFRLEATPVIEPVAAPVLGQHTSEVLGELLGLEEGAIQALSAKGAFGQKK